MLNTTKQRYRTQTSEHIGVSPLTGKCVKNNSQTSAVHDHMLSCKTAVCPEDFSILAKSSCKAQGPRAPFFIKMQQKIVALLFDENIASGPPMKLQ